MNHLIKERNLIVEKLLSIKNIPDGDIEFLTNYFQFQKDIKRTFIFYPVKVDGRKLTFKRGILFGKNMQNNLDILLKSRIDGAIYFYAKLNKDMNLEPSEKLRVYIFLSNLADTNNGSQYRKNLFTVNDIDNLPSITLKEICSEYIF